MWRSIRRLVTATFEGCSTGRRPGLDLTGPFVVLDLSALYNSPALGVLMVCATAWLQAALARTRRRGAGGRVLVVVDEAWAVLANLAVARWLQSSWKLSRAYGVANMAVLHRLSDLAAGGRPVRAGRSGQRPSGRLRDAGGLRPGAR